MTENENSVKIAIIGGGRSAGRTLKAHLDLVEELEAYKAIGTVEDINEVMKSGAYYMEIAHRFQSIGTIEEFKALKEKNEPKKPIDKLMYLECPTCGDVGIEGCGYCPCCGQKLDWE